MLQYQYEVMWSSLAVGLVFIVAHRLSGTSWFLSRLTLLLAILGFVPAGLVFLAHIRETWIFNFIWWDNSNVAWTTYRSPRLETIEVIVMIILWSIIRLSVIAIIFSK
jgi:hypothetical protein